MALDPVPTYPGNYDANEANNSPSGSETRREGDDQIRRMKASEKATWANVTGAVTSSHTELNTLTGISTTDPIITFPAGGVTKLTFFQNSAPPKWTIDGTVDDTMLRFTQGSGLGGETGGTTAGTYSFSVLFANLPENNSPGVGGHVITIGQMPNHDHGGGIHEHNVNVSTDGTNTGANGNVSLEQDNNGNSDIFSPFLNNFMIGESGKIINSQGGNQAHYHSFDNRAAYSTCIVASLD